MGRKVYFITDEKMLLHRCEWDQNHIEKPERLTAVLCKLGETDILNRCIHLRSRRAGQNEICLVHSERYVEQIAATQTMTPEECEAFASEYDDVFFNKHTYLAASLSAGCSLEAMEAVLLETARRSAAFAAVRPPGHHASLDTACGFCIFNNVAICAKKARNLGQEKVLILDWDVHAAQGTQYAIADDPNIKLISIHRYEYGRFWPNLPESAICNQYENTINVPLNVTGLGDSEYIAFVQHFVVPIINDFAPSLILVSSGFDAAFGDDEGEMKITPAGYYWMTKLVMDAAAVNGSSLCFLMEGGYFIDSVAYGALFSLKALLGDSEPNIRLHKCNCDFLHSLHSAILFHAAEFPSLQLLLDISKTLRCDHSIAQIRPIKREYREIRLQPRKPYPTRNQYPKKPEQLSVDLKKRLEKMVASYTYGPTEQKETSVTVLEKVTDDSDSDEELQIEAGGWHVRAVIDFMNVHVFNTPCTTIKLSELNLRNERHLPKYQQMYQEMINGENRNYHDKLVRDAIFSGLCKLFVCGLCENFEHFMLFEVSLA